MNLTVSIKHQIDRIKELDKDIPIDLILNHLVRAEQFYDLGIKENDENFFTDVIYRTNQVFEGALRIAYMVLSEKTEKQSNRKRTVDIEDYMTDNKILKDRVLEQFTNYRKEWRNPATHDFKILFSESESVLAISNVSAFTYVLLNQVIQKLSYNIESRTKIENRKKIDEVLKQDIAPIDKLVQILISFNKTHKVFLSREYLREVEVIGALSSFLNSNDKMKIEVEVPLKAENTKARADLIVQIEKEKFVVEVKRPNSPERLAYRQQVMNYLAILKIKYGIVFIPNGIKEVKRQYSQPSILDDTEMILIG